MIEQALELMTRPAGPIEDQILVEDPVPVEAELVDRCAAEDGSGLARRTEGAAQEQQYQQHPPDGARGNCPDWTKGRPEIRSWIALMMTSPFPMPARNLSPELTPVVRFKLKDSTAPPEQGVLLLSFVLETRPESVTKRRVSY